MANGKKPDNKAVRLAPELDAAWIIALWLAIHGGDPAPEQIAVEAIAALSRTLTAHSGEAIAESSFAELQTRLKEIGVNFHSDTKAEIAAARSTQPRKIRTYCVTVNGETICTQFPMN